MNTFLQFVLRSLRILNLNELWFVKNYSGTFEIGGTFISKDR